MTPAEQTAPFDLKGRLKDFVNLTKRVRVAQQLYFRTRDKETLLKPKKLEIELDIQINKIKNAGTG